MSGSRPGTEPADFAVGDRVQFTDTLKAARIHNGNAGTITAIDARTGAVTATLDGPGGRGREVAWSAAAFAGFRHGYAGTIYKGQGRTLDHTYLYHSRHWRRASSYVALTRQRESARIFAATETARDVRELARQMGRDEVRAASVAWATRRGAAAGAAARGRAARRARGRGAPVRQGDVGAGPRARSWTRAGSSHPGSRPAPIDPGEVAAAVAADPAARRERAALDNYLEGAFRDPGEARARLDELVGTHGHASAARRLAADPGQLGELRGRTGLFAGGAAREERARAGRVAGAVGPAVARLGAAEAAAAAAFRERAEARRAADATGVPRLSGRARAAVEALGAAGDGGGRAAAWAALRADGGVAGELDGFVRAVERRFGAEGVRALARGSGLEGARVGEAERVALAEVGRVVRAVHEARLAASAEAQRLAVGQRARQGARLKP